MEERENITNAADVMFFCCHSVDVFTCPDSQMPRMDDTTNRPMRCSRSNPLSCPSEFVCERLLDGSNACCPNPFSSQICSEAVTDANNLPVPCTGWDDGSCQEGKCRRALDGKNYCCRSTADHGSDPYESQFIKMRTELLHSALSRRMLNEALSKERTTTIARAPASPRSSGSRRPAVKGKGKFSNSRRYLPYYLRRIERIKNIIP
ncbi:hypothetical protein Y032_0347g3159 [Ancylostoma ceylanicum]|nr:hypothetical protein Y032_0347g3159 [Ancylostoma ceylanicum]